VLEGSSRAITRRWAMSLRAELEHQLERRARACLAQACRVAEHALDARVERCIVTLAHLAHRARLDAREHRAPASDRDRVGGRDLEARRTALERQRTRIFDRKGLARLLRAKGLPHHLEPIRPARAPPQQGFEFGP